MFYYSTHNMYFTLLYVCLRTVWTLFMSIRPTWCVVLFESPVSVLLFYSLEEPEGLDITGFGHMYDFLNCIGKICVERLCRIHSPKGASLLNPFLALVIGEISPYMITLDLRDSAKHRVKNPVQHPLTEVSWRIWAEQAQQMPEAEPWAWLS